MGHLLVTNDFPPKIGGIQNVLYEMWRRLPPLDVTVFTTAYEGAESFDSSQEFEIVRSKSKVLLPTPKLVHQIRGLASKRGASLVVLDPALPLGLVAKYLGRPYAVTAHGAEIAVPARLPVARTMLASVLAGAELVIAFGRYPEEEARRAAAGTGGRTGPGAGASAQLKRVVNVPPGVDSDRFRPLSDVERSKARARLGLPAEGRLVVSVSRLVPRKGMDVLIQAAGLLSVSMPDLCVAIGGSGRDSPRLKRLAERSGANIVLLGRVSDEDLPLLDGAADAWAMLCRNRWGGLEQEGFGIVFMEAAATGVPQVAGRSGGADEAVVHNETGLVVDMPTDPAAAAAALRKLLENESLRKKLGQAARHRAMREFNYDLLASRLRASLEEAGA